MTFSKSVEVRSSETVMDFGVYVLGKGSIGTEAMFQLLLRVAPFIWPPVVETEAVMLDNYFIFVHYFFFLQGLETFNPVLVCLLLTLRLCIDPPFPGPGCFLHQCRPSCQ